MLLVIRSELYDDLIRPFIGSEFDERCAKAWLAESATQNLIARSAKVAASVTMGRGNLIMPNVIVTGNTTIGNRNVFLGAVQVGAPSRQRIEHDPIGPVPSNTPRLTIGNDNIFEDHVSIHLPVAEETVVGDDVSIGAGTHVAHDCVIQSNAVIAANCSLGGYVWIGNSANLGLAVSIHPRTAIGAYAMCGAGAAVVRHVSPSAMVAGTPARFLDYNRRGLMRAGLSESQISAFVAASKLTDLPSLPPQVSKYFQDFSAARQTWGRDKGTIP